MNDTDNENEREKSHYDRQITGQVNFVHNLIYSSASFKYIIINSPSDILFRAIIFFHTLLFFMSFHGMD